MFKDKPDKEKITLKFMYPFSYLVDSFSKTCFECVIFQVMHSFMHLLVKES